MIKTLLLSALIIIITATVLSGQTEYLPKKVYEAYRVDVPPVINGVRNGTEPYLHRSSMTPYGEYRARLYMMLFEA